MKHKKILSVFLVLMMLIGMLPQMTITALAEEIEVVEVEIKEPLLEAVPVVISGGAYIEEYSWNATEVPQEGITYQLTLLIHPEDGNQFNTQQLLRLMVKK